jgi:hypothetical protein
MRVFEANDAPLVCVVPEIADLSSYLESHAQPPGFAQMSKIYLDTITII